MGAERPLSPPFPVSLLVRVLASLVIPVSLLVVKSRAMGPGAGRREEGVRVNVVVAGMLEVYLSCRLCSTWPIYRGVASTLPTPVSLLGLYSRGVFLSFLLQPWGYTGGRRPSPSSPVSLLVVENVSFRQPLSETESQF